MDTLLFSIGSFIFMLTIYGSVMAGGAALKRQQIKTLADDVAFVTNDDGVEILVGVDPDKRKSGTASVRTARRDDPTT